MVLGISTDPPEANQQFHQQQRFPFPLLSDADRTVCIAYGACSFKKAYYANRITYVIDERGIVAKVFPEVQASRHAEELLQVL